MRMRRVAVLGGGPGGLYAARLLKLAQPLSEVVVYEQDEPQTTFGFGVGLAAATQRKLEAADPITLRGITSAGRRHDMSMNVRGRAASIRQEGLIGIARTQLLAVLERHAQAAGVRIEFGVRRTTEELDAQIVIAADGAGSATRAAGDFGEALERGRGLYLWSGADFALPTGLFAPVETAAGIFVTHAYPHSDRQSTFLIEADPHTVHRAGLGITSDAPPYSSDLRSLEYLEHIFAEHLRGHPLIGNRTRWTPFRTVRCDRWSDGRVVLLGDAAHTAHYSIGSGTKLAMEDAIGLVQALDSEADERLAFRRYEAERRPAVERMQELARRSRLWWESFPTRLDLPVEQLMVSFMTRAGNVSIERLVAECPDVATAALSQYAGVDGRVSDDLVDWILEQPLTRGPVEFGCRVVAGSNPDIRWRTITAAVADTWGPAGDRIVAGARKARAGGADGFQLVGSPDRSAVLSRLELAERLRNEVGGVVAVLGPERLRADLAAGLVSGRTDLVSFGTED